MKTPDFLHFPYLKPSLFGAPMNYINTHPTSTSAGDLAECRCAWSFPAIKLEVSSLLSTGGVDNLPDCLDRLQQSHCRCAGLVGAAAIQLHNSVIVLPSCCVFLLLSAACTWHAGPSRRGAVREELHINSTKSLVGSPSGMCQHHAERFPHLNQRAITEALGEGELHINSTKSMIGHLLGAAGAVEAVAVVQALQTGAQNPFISNFS